MRINNNMMAMNTHRQLGIANTGGAKSMEKLSSGFRINRAGDDAAGLAISEKMRGQIRGLNQASTNSQDAISLIQTTEGALNETHAILQRMRELAVQSATDTNTNADRGNLQDEIDQLSSEISRIANTTQFNTMNLLDGTFEGKKFHIGANESQNISFDVKDMGAAALGVTGYKFVEDVEELKISVAVREPGETLEKGQAVTVSIAKGEIKENPTESTGDFKEEYKVVKDEDGNITINLRANVESDDGDVLVSAGKITHDQLVAELKNLGYEVEIKEGYKGDTEITEGKDELVAGEAARVNGEEFGVNISTQSSADKAITDINSALETVSKERSKLGAIQNRLEHTIKNLDTSAENLQASESRIRDVDMAKEMMEQTKQNILQQASTAMLAQANMAPQTVLQLLG